MSELAADRLSFRAEHDSPGDILVAIYLRGGMDGIYTVQPLGDPAYARQRERLSGQSAADGARPVPLDSMFALHPDFAPLADLYRGGMLAIVHACGIAEPLLSHFDATRVLEHGASSGGPQDGWLGRHLGSRVPDVVSPVRAIAMGAMLPPVLRGAAGATAIRSIDELRLDLPAAWSSDFMHALRAWYAPGNDSVSVAGRQTLDLLDRLTHLPSSGTPPRAKYPNGLFGLQLAQVARLIKADLGLEVAVLNLYGWDTHVAQVPALAQPMLDLSTGLRALFDDISGQPRRVLVAVMSEFGRRVVPNGGEGTDHGRATAMLVLGHGVRGGKVYHRWPGLAPEQLDADGNLPVTIDFRDVAAELVERRLGNARVQQVFPDYSPTYLGLAESAG